MRTFYLQNCNYGSRFRILKGGKISLVVSAFLAGAVLLHAAPSGGVVTAGSASIAQSGSVTNITQTTNKAAINWQNFSIGKSETVNFNQPNVNAVTLNRVVGNEKSVINGALNANGQVFILNSNGVLFSKTASINTAGLVATTMNLSDADFMDGNYAFKGDSQASVINQGTINISDKGYAALFGKEVKNEGFIKATLGKVELVGAKELTLNLNGNSLVNLKVDKGILDALVENKGAIYAEGGEVYLTTNAVGELLRGVVNNQGIIEANSLEDITGKIVLFAHGGTGEFGGSLSTGKGEGFIETSGKEFVHLSSLHVETGEWLIDPVNITIDTALAGAISTALGSANVKVTTDTTDSTRYNTSSGQSGANGDIFVNSGITWTSGNALTLHAYRNIEINAAITASSGSGGRLVLEYGQGALASANTAYYLINAPISLQASGITNGDNGATLTNFSTKLGADGTAVNYTTITDNTGTVLNTQSIVPNNGGNFALSTDIALSGTNNWTLGTTFEGRFEGLGHTIDGLNIVGTDSQVGLFGQLNDAYIGNIHLSNATVEGNTHVGILAGDVNPGSLIVNASSSGSVVGVDDGAELSFSVGGLVGNINGGKITFSHSSAEVGLKDGSTGGDGFGGLVGANKGIVERSYATGEVSGKGRVGGLVGHNYNNGTISSTYATGKVTGVDYVGGLAGGNAGGGTISNTYATGEVTGNGSVGGLVGQVDSFSSIESSYATGSVTGTGAVGGLVGTNSSSTIINSYATGSITGDRNVGGLAGWAYASASITNSYATGSVTGNQYVGGLVGQVTPASITNSYATGSVTGNQYVGGLAGRADASSTITNSFWDKETSGQATSAGGTGKTTVQMMNPSTFTDAGWLTSIWSFPTVEGGGATVEGYEVGGGLPYLKDVTRAQDIITSYETLFAGGFGTALNPYTLTNWTQLQNINYASDRTLLSKYYTLSNNIDSTTTGYTALASSTANSGAGWVPIGNLNYKFTGTFNGGGHTITGLFINRPTTDNVGLFGYTDGATIQNVGVINGNIVGSNSAGGLVGLAYNSTCIENSYATGSVRGASSIGGLVGWAYTSASIENSYATGSVTGNQYIGGLVGQAYTSASITNSYATGSVSGTSFVGGLVGRTYTSATITNSYATGSVSGTSFVGGLVGFDNGGTITNSFWDTQASGQATSAGGGTGKTTAQMMDASTYAGWNTTIWSIDGSTTAGYALGGLPYLKNVTRAQDIVTSSETLFAGGFGTALNPYTLTNWTQLQNINYASDRTLLSKYYTLSNNIDSTTTGYTALASSAANSGAGWVPIDFEGNFNGGGHTITGLFINRPTTDHVGLFGYADGATVQNVGVINSTITGRNNVGGLAGTADNSSSITNSYATGSITGTGGVGGLVGIAYNYSSITNSYATGSVTATDDLSTGGLVGKVVSASITNSYATGSVTGTSRVGGLVGHVASSRITNSYATGSVSGSGDSVGGLVGFDDSGTITNSFWDTETSGQTTSAGGEGKTTAQMRTLSTFAGWDITGTDGGYPTLTLGGATIWTMSPSPIGLSYTLSTQNHVYRGSIYTLADFWSASSIFGASYASWVLGTDYIFIYDGSSTTGFKNAGTYSNITIDILKSGYTEALSGNTTGALTIAQKALTITGLTASNKTYDGTTNVTMTNWGHLVGLVGTETLTLGHGTASFENAEVGNSKTVTATDYTLSDGDNGGVVGNYLLALNTATTTANITSATPTPPAPTPPAPTPPTQDLTPVITQIINGTAITPPVLPNFTPRLLLAQAPQQFTFAGAQVQLTSTPSGDAPSQRIGMQEARAMLQGGGTGDIRIPLGQNSLIQLMNGGIHLPNGLEQEFFMTQR